jgi:hypothetical protein
MDFDLALIRALSLLFFFSRVYQRGRLRPGYAAESEKTFLIPIYTNIVEETISLALAYFRVLRSDPVRYQYPELVLSLA